MNKEKILFNLINSLLISFVGFVGFILHDVKLSFGFLIIFLIFLIHRESFKHESSFIFDKSIFLVVFSILLIGIFSDGNIYLFTDDKKYFENSKYYLNYTYINLFQSYLFEIDLDYNNFQYLAVVLFKLFGYSQIVFWVFNLFIISKLLSFIYDGIKFSDFTGNKFLLWFPYELIFFSFFLFKDLFMVFILTEFLKYFIKTDNILKLILACVLLIFLVDPLRVGFSYLFILTAFLFKFRNSIKFFILKPPVIPIIIVFILIFYSTNYILPLLNEDLSFKYNFYKMYLIDRSSSTQGFLNLFYSQFYSGNVFFAIPIVLVSVFTPILSVPDDTSMIVFMIIRFITLTHFLFAILDYNSNKINFNSKFRISFFLLIILSASHLSLASGMLRHSMVILPFLYCFLNYRKLNSNKLIYED